jgi:hypothetical protein
VTPPIPKKAPQLAGIIDYLAKASEKKNKWSCVPDEKDDPQRRAALPTRRKEILNKDTPENTLPNDPPIVSRSKLIRYTISAPSGRGSDVTCVSLVFGYIPAQIVSSNTTFFDSLY